MTPDLSKPELSILSILWKQQPLSVRELHDRLGNDWAYTTTKTVMDRMSAKGLLERNTIHGVIVYRAKISRAEGLTQWVRFIAEKLFETEADEVVSLFAKRKTYHPQEIADLRELIRKAEASEGKQDEPVKSEAKNKTKKQPL
jgi:predicted transcriptional regulator